MAKILKVKIKRDQTPERTHYTYPPEYDARKIQVMVYESILPENLQIVKDRGNKDEYLLGVVKDEDAAQFLASKDIAEINYNIALNQGNQWTKQVLKMTDPEKIALICQKVANDEALTTEEKNALDSDNPEPGVMKSKSFQEALDELLAKL